MIELILASGNKHKASEYEDLLDPTVFSVQASPEKLDIVEDGATFSENSLKKAEGFYKKFKKPVIADDSGLNVELLPDELGIRSARFGGDGLTDRARAELLLTKMSGASEEKRGAFFTCVICIYLNPEEIYFFEGRLEGKIGHEIKGEGGFGYDPIFIPNGGDGVKTVAMMEEWKRDNSHRAQASQFANKFFKERVCSPK